MRNKPPPRGLRGGGLFYIHLFDYEQLPVIAQREILSFINDKIRQNHIFVAHIEQKSSARLIAGLYAGRAGTEILYLFNFLRKHQLIVIPRFDAMHCSRKRTFQISLVHC